MVLYVMLHWTHRLTFPPVCWDYSIDARSLRPSLSNCPSNGSRKSLGPWGPANVIAPSTGQNVIPISQHLFPNQESNQYLWFFSIFEGAPGEVRLLLVTLTGEKVLCNITISRSQGANSIRGHNLDLLLHCLSEFRELCTWDHRYLWTML